MRRCLLAMLLLVVFTGACVRSDSAPASREEPFMVRSFQPVSGDRWIGNAVCYGPHRDGQHPDGRDPSADEIREDLNLMQPHWNLLRIYASSGFAETLLTVSRNDGFDMKVMLGVWIAPEDEINRQEIEAAIRLTRAFPEIVVAVCVGNETQIDWSAHRSPLEGLIEHVRRVRAGVTVPVTAADDFNYWNKPESRTLAAEIDFVTMHAHPLWNGQQLDDGMTWLKEQVSEVEALHSDRTVVLGETGWATSVHDQGEQAELIKGRAGEAEQAVFYNAARSWAQQERKTVFIFEAFDENWKGGDHPDEVEKHWGLYRADRTAKAVFVE